MAHNEKPPQRTGAAKVSSIGRERNSVTDRLCSVSWWFHPRRDHTGFCGGGGAEKGGITGKSMALLGLPYEGQRNGRRCRRLPVLMTAPPPVAKTGTGGGALPAGSAVSPWHPSFCW